ncbi:hypothetical protein AOLI_G00011650 [Acnodon oligacanthus]
MEQDQPDHHPKYKTLIKNGDDIICLDGATPELWSSSGRSHSTTSVFTSSPLSPQLTLRGQTSPAYQVLVLSNCCTIMHISSFPLKLTSLRQAFSIILSDPLICRSIPAASNELKIKISSKSNFSQ